MSNLTPERRAEKARWAARKRRLVGYGKWQPFVDAEPVRAHVRAIQAAGMPPKALEAQLGLPRHAFKHLLWGSSGYGPAAEIRKEKADLVLGYWPTLDDFPDSALIDSTGTRRRMQALSVMGWTNLWMAEQIGMRPAYFESAVRGERVTARLARDIRRLYGRFWSRGPYDFEISSQIATRTRNRAADRGWASPLAWDDDTIDDPAAVPQFDAPPAAEAQGDDCVDRWLMGEDLVLSPKDRKKALLHLYEWSTLSPAQIADRLEISEAAAEQTWFRHKKKLRDAGRPVPWRRRWELRNKELTKTEMGEAA